MDAAAKARRTIRHKTLKAIAKHVRASYLGLYLTESQIKAAAKTLYRMRTVRYIRFGRFHWEWNNANKRVL